MMGVAKWQREGRKMPVNVTERYPSETATGRYTPAQSLSDSRDVAPASDAELRACNCAQCGAHIEDSSALATCWWCGSDNFLGRPL